MSAYLTYDSAKTLSFTLPERVTGWNAAPASNIALSQMAQDLPDIAEGVANTFKSEDLSMPSPWAKFVAFETILYDSKTYGDVHKQAIIDWRCLLTIIALHDFLGIKINMDGNGNWTNTINLGMLTGNSYTDRLYKDVRQIYPQNSIFSLSLNATEWDVFTPILLGNDFDVIGFLSNSTLVCTPYSLSPAARLELDNTGLFSMGKFVDPIARINSDADMAYAMRQFLDILYSNLGNIAGMPGANSHMINKISQLVDKFRNDIIVNPMLSSNVIVKNRGAENPKGLMTVCGMMGSVEVSVPIPESHVLLQGCLKTDVNVYVVGNSMYGTDCNQSAANSINVIENKKLSHLPPSFRSGERNFGDYILQPNEYIYRDVDFLLNDLYFIEPNISSESIMNQGVDSGTFAMLGNKDIIWPVSEELFEFVPAEEIRKNIKIVYDGGDSYIVMLSLPLSNGMHTFSKTYTRSNIHVVQEIDMPHVAIWPYIKVVNPGGGNENLWKSYYVYQSFFKMDTCMNARVCCDAKVIPNENVLDLISTKELGNTYSEYSALPTHIKISRKGTMNTTCYCGAVLLAPPDEKTVSTATSWTVGVDFGTTSSAVYYKSGAESKFIKFGTQHWNEFNPGTGKTEIVTGKKENSGLFIAIKPGNLPYRSRDFFMPETYLKRDSYPTVYETLTADVPAGTLTSFTYGHIPYDYGLSPTRTAVEMRVHKYNDMKWNSDPGVREATKKYLHQLFMQIIFTAMNSGVGKINWRFSYPTALSVTLLSNFKQSVHSILEHITRTTGIECKEDQMGDAGNGQKQYYSESIVSAEYFMTTHGVGNVACVDIGGGTTDISIWKRGLQTQNLLQTSIKLASRDIFLESFGKLLRDDAVIRNNVLSLNQPLKESLGDNINRENLPMIESLLFEYESAVREYANILDNPNNQINLIRTVSFGFFALMFYTVDAMRLAKSDLEGEQSIAICIGGNGAKLLDWLPEFYIPRVEEVLRRYIKDEVGLNLSITIRYNPQTLKAEASKGLLLVSDPPNKFDANLKLPASENLILTKMDGTTEELDATEDIYTREDVIQFFNTAGNGDAVITKADGTQIQGIKAISVSDNLNAIKKVIEYFNDVNASFEDNAYLLSYTDVDYANIHSSMQFELNQAARENRIEPAFVFGIKAILKRENK